MDKQELGRPLGGVRRVTLKPFDLQVGDLVATRINTKDYGIESDARTIWLRFKVVGIYDYIIHCESVGGKFPFRESFPRTDYQYGIIRKCN